MANQLDLRDLRYFEVIAETGHVGRAAKKLHRTQPALTGCVRRLEEVVGTPLFERVGRNIRLTAAGHALAARARSLRVAADEAMREIGDLGAGVAGHVRIGVLPTLARFLLPDATHRFLAEAPAVTIKAVVAQNDVLGAQLSAGELDLVVTTAIRGDASIVRHAVCEDDAVVIASARHPILRVEKPRIDDLLDYRWVLAPEVVGTREWLERRFRDRGLPAPRVQIETNLILMMPALIERTALLTFTSRRHVAPFDPRSPLREVALRDTTMRRRFDVAYRRDSYLSPAALRFMELLRTRGEEIFTGSRR
jgi:DNA-binding transcriptional LysR family regulator